MGSTCAGEKRTRNNCPRCKALSRRGEQTAEQFHYCDLGYKAVLRALKRELECETMKINGTLLSSQSLEMQHELAKTFLQENVLTAERAPTTVEELRHAMNFLAMLLIIEPEATDPSLFRGGATGEAVSDAPADRVVLELGCKGRRASKTEAKKFKSTSLELDKELLFNRSFLNFNSRRLIYLMQSPAVGAFGAFLERHRQELVAAASENKSGHDVRTCRELCFDAIFDKSPPAQEFNQKSASLLFQPPSPLLKRPHADDSTEAESPSLGPAREGSLVQAETSPGVPPALPRLLLSKNLAYLLSLATVSRGPLSKTFADFLELHRS